MNEIICKKKKGSLGSLLLSAVLALSLAGCGTPDSKLPDNTNNGASTSADGYVYVAEYKETDIGYVENLTLLGDHLYYSSYKWDELTETGAYHIYRTPISTPLDVEELPIYFPSERNPMHILFTNEGYILAFLLEVIENPSNPMGYDSNTFLAKYDEAGQILDEQDITHVLHDSGTEDSYIQSVSRDKEGNIYALSERTIFLFREDGSFHGSATIDIYPMGLGNSKDGKVYVTNYNGDNIILSEIDFDSKSIGATHSFRTTGTSGNNKFQPGIDMDILNFDEYKVFEYDFSEERYHEILNWMDCDINGQYINNLTVTEDGSIIAFYREWGNMDAKTEMIHLTKKPAAEVAEKEVIVVGTLNIPQLLQDMVVNFNKTNDKYRIILKAYEDEVGQSDNPYWDGMVVLNNEIIAGKGPDIIMLNDNLPILSYVNKGLFEDLTPYLEKSPILKPSDIVESVLNAYTYDGKLIGIPNGFQVATILGKTSIVGEKPGWTLGEMMDFAASYPEAEIFAYATKETILDDCLRYNQDSFIDYASGICYFDTDDFKKVLRYANMFPGEFINNSGEKSTPRKIQDNELLLGKATFSNTLDYPMNANMFEAPVTCIGYPTIDGHSGNMLYSSMGACSISSQSEKKDGAWEFIEYMLLDSTYGRMFFHDFPSLIKNLEAMIDEDMKVEYIKDSNDELMLDENGEPMMRRKTGWVWDDWETYIYAVTQAEVDKLWDVINSLQPVTGYDRKIMDIILEEAQAYFEGQKTEDEVAKIIQGRIQLYIGENM